MHLVEESFYTLHLRKWEAARIWNEIRALLDESGEEVSAYPALSAFYEAIAHTAREEDTSEVVPEITPADTEE